MGVERQGPRRPFPSQVRNLADARPDLVAFLDAEIRAVVDYPAVARDVAAYDRASLRLWVNKTRDWRADLDARGLRWHAAWAANRAANEAELEAFLDRDVAVAPCRKALHWPPRGG
jgi:hypothetical protein